MANEWYVAIKKNLT